MGAGDSERIPAATTATKSLSAGAEMMGRSVSRTAAQAAGSNIHAGNMHRPMPGSSTTNTSRPPRFCRPHTRSVWPWKTWNLYSRRAVSAGACS